MTENEIELVTIRYTNWRGETGTRIIKPQKIWFGETEWHPKRQWLLDAIDIEKEALRNFAMKDIHEWKVCSDDGLNKEG